MRTIITVQDSAARRQFQANITSRIWLGGGNGLGYCSWPEMCRPRGERRKMKRGRVGIAFVAVRQFAPPAVPAEIRPQTCTTSVQ